MNLFGRTDKRRRPPAPRARVALEQLETRLVPYSVSGNAWPGAERVTISFVPDGTLMSSGTGGDVYSNLFAKMNSRWATATWQAEIAKAAQVWAQHANLNFDFVSDNGMFSGGGDYQQGDPGMGDIRIGAYAFSNNYLGMGYMPPPANNYSIAGDWNYNSKQTFNIGTTYDLQTVAMHEFGHTLGVYHSSAYGTVMYPSYNGMKRALTSDDIAAVQAIYGARQPDAYEGPAGNNDFLTATLLTLNTLDLTAQLPRLDITSTSDPDYFTVQAPLGGSGALRVHVQSDGLSLLRPKVTVYKDGLLGKEVVASGSGAGLYDGSTISLTVNNVSALETYYVKVEGADTTAFGTGRYALTVNFGSGPSPAVPLPNTQLLAGETFVGGDGLAEEKKYEAMEAEYYAINDSVPHHPSGEGHDEHDGHDGEGHGPGSFALGTSARGLAAGLVSVFGSPDDRGGGFGRQGPGGHGGGPWGGLAGLALTLADLGDEDGGLGWPTDVTADDEAFWERARDLLFGDPGWQGDLGAGW